MLSENSQKQQVSTVQLNCKIYDIPEKSAFFMSHGHLKRKIYYNTEYSEEEKKNIADVRKSLKEQGHIKIQEQQTLLRYWYTSDFDMKSCLSKLKTHFQWFHNPQIQNFTKEAQQIFEKGFIYSGGKGKQGRPLVIMNLAVLDLDRYTVNNYYQVLNIVNNKVIKDQFIPGYVQTYDYVLDLQQKFLTLPITSLASIIGVISDVYSMRLEKLKLVNCTMAAKWLYNRLQNFLPEQTARKIQSYTNQDVINGVLLQLVDEDVLQVKYGGNRQNIIHNLRSLQINQSVVKNPLDQTQYFSIQQNQQFFNNEGNMHCCADYECTIY